ncbi:MAG: hypothetical protein LBT79_05375 [Elusimicrobiota bacterium]|jgi:hypothetical protein|nr:hypothetical protein [Elusimicrobiota bacterium]
MKTVKIVIIFIIAAFLGACVSSPKRAALNDGSFNKKDLPSWIGKTWTQTPFLYAGGISGECAALQQARQEAYIDALRKVAEYGGMSISNEAFFVTHSENVNVSDFVNMSIEETALSKAQITEFEYSKTSEGKFVGYVLLQYDMNIIEAEKKRKEELEKQRKQELENRKKLGSFYVSAPQSLSLLVPDIKSFFQKEGYLIADSGRPITVTLIDDEYIERSGGWTATIKTEVNFNSKIIITQASGFGKNKKEAFNEAVRRWLNYFKDDYLK